MPFSPRAQLARAPLCALLVVATAPMAAAQRSATRSTEARAAEAQSALVSAPVSDIIYDVAFDPAAGAARRVKVSMSFATPGAAPVILSLPAWTPGAYEISYFSKWVSAFAVTGDGKPLAWDKTDHDTWRIRPEGAKAINVSFTYTADSLDNAMAWARRDFLLFNGTNLFLYPEGRGFDFGAAVRVHTAPDWLVATGMAPAGPAASQADRLVRAAAPKSAAPPPRVSSSTFSYSASSYHDLVDMPFFVGRFDLDSARIADRWVRFASYPAGSVSGAQRKEVWDQLAKVIPPQVAVFGEAPWTTYTVMQIVDSSYGGASGLEHANSHVDVVSPYAIGDPFMPSLYAHEIFHSWNVKRLRPAELWPYQYAAEQPTPWLWVSEGITDYYADLAQIRGGVVDSAAFLALTADKIQEVASAPPVALEDASLSTWAHPTDGTATLYYPKGSLAGLLLDISIRDASDNRRSLDDVMRGLYRDTYKAGRGFTPDEWWRAVSAAAGGKSFTDFNARYVDGRDPYPWTTMLPLAGLRLAADTIREPAELGISAVPDDKGAYLVTATQPGSVAESAGVRTGDFMISIGDIAVADPQFGEKFRTRFSGKEGSALPIRVRRGGELLTLNGQVRMRERYQTRIVPDASGGSKALRIRAGILRGAVDK
ncbi:MAG: hypothetical protein WKG32_08065 [Gemmatimonadaceae bacterium]